MRCSDLFRQTIENQCILDLILQTKTNSLIINALILVCKIARFLKEDIPTNAASIQSDQPSFRRITKFPFLLKYFWHMPVYLYVGFRPDVSEAGTPNGALRNDITANVCYRDQQYCIRHRAIR